MRKIAKINKAKYKRRPTNSANWQRLRAYVLARDNYTCQIKIVGICMAPYGEKLSAKNLHVDHIKPVSHGGRDVISNLRAACRPCNQHIGNNNKNDKVYKPSRVW